MNVEHEPVTPMVGASRFEFIYLTLRNRICLLDYEPGARLSEETLAREFSVSRTPMRRVLGRLEAEGLVEVRHGVGNLVTNIELSYLCDVFRLRMEIVPQIGLLSPLPVTAGLLDRIVTVENDCMLLAGNHQPKRAFAQLNIVFFELLMELVGNPSLREILSLLFYRSSRMWPYLMTDEAVQVEAGIFQREISETRQLLQSGAIAAVGQLRRTHISMALQRLRQLLEQQGRGQTSP
ncbi:GntR family transcriptional regulator [Gynuella sp.]|uniref:GntR family transcriptional regulator n=1 Tax=Gynuella sp. TaxID=2969146 RepID=UPI003D1401F0